MKRSLSRPVFLLVLIFTSMVKVTEAPTSADL